MSKQAVLNKSICLYITWLQKKTSSFNNILGIVASKAKSVQMQGVINFRTNSTRTSRSLSWLCIRITQCIPQLKKEKNYLVWFSKILMPVTPSRPTRSNRPFCDYGNFCTVWYAGHQPPMLMSTWDGASETESLNFSFYLIFIDLNVSSHCGYWLLYWTVQL